MLDFSFSELAIIGAVALVVLGPEKLPKVARTAGQWVSKAQRYVNDVKADIQRETELAELKKLQEDVQQSARELENSLHQNLNSIESDLQKTATEAGALPPAAESAALTDASTFGDRYDSAFHSQGEFVKPAPTIEALADRIEALQRQIAQGGSARFKYAPRARAMRAAVRRARTAH